MKIGIIGAMEVEVNELKNKIENLKTEIISGIEFSIGELCGCDVAVAKCGVGKVNAAICAQTMIIKYNVDLILNTGVAGGLGKNINVFDVVIAKDVVQHDFDLTPLGEPLGLISEIGSIKIPCAKNIVEKMMSAAVSLTETKVYVGTIATGDQFIQSHEIKSNLVSKFDAIAVEMEGGSIGHVCSLADVDFCVIRAISDGADDSSNIDFPEFVLKAADTSTKLIIAFLSTLNK